ncbi:MAG TPA: hypothetical protein PLD27_01605 [bacterium]|nr:hypothetical protein [bacterium]HOL46592.1 hypothetical protein [bacterium]HPQ17837.1 hypothetical protein [bacterium]
MKLNFLKNTNSFSLIELVISIGILIPALIVSYQISFNYFDTFERFEDYKNINYLVHHYLEKFNYDELALNKEVTDNYRINDKNYFITFLVKDFELVQLFKINFLDSSYIEQYKKFISDLNDLKIISVTIKNDKKQQFNFSKIILLKNT